MKSLAEYESFRENHPRKIDVMRTQGVGAHFHHQMEILCVTRGNINATINDKAFSLKRGDICVSDSYDVHSYEIKEKGSIGYVLIVPKNYLTDYSAVSKNLILSQNYLRKQEAFDLIEPLIVSLYNQLDLSNEIYIKGITSAIMGVIYQVMEYKEHKYGDKDYIMRDVLGYIHENFDKNITLASLSKHFGYTPNHFSHMFNSFTKCGLKEYINSVRCDNAANLLYQGHSIIDSAMNSGFDSLRTFYRAFLAHFNTTPKLFIKKN